MLHDIPNKEKIHIYPYTIIFYVHVAYYTLYAYWQHLLTVGVLPGILVSGYMRLRHNTRSCTNDNKHLTEYPSPTSLINERQGFMSISDNKGVVFLNQLLFQMLQANCTFVHVPWYTLSHPVFD